MPNKKQFIIGSTQGLTLEEFTALAMEAMYG